jgi:hypothetical protein
LVGAGNGPEDEQRLHQFPSIVPERFGDSRFHALLMGLSMQPIWDLFGSVNLSKTVCEIRSVKTIV